jgi:hypothetical protein
MENLMISARSITTTAVLSLFALGNAWADDEARNFAPLFGDVHATAGQEIILPYLKFNDVSPADGYPESVNVSYKVYTAGTTTLRRQTQVKTIPTPPIPAGCTAAEAGDNLDLDVFFTRRGALLNASVSLVAASKRMALAINLHTECDSNPDPLVYSWTESVRGLVYSADLSGTEAGGLPGPAWYKTWAGRVVMGLNGVDVDNDLVNDFQMITTGGETITESSNVSVVYAASKTGAINTAITTSKGNAYTLPTSGIIYTVIP